MYSWALLFVTLTGIAAWFVIKEKKPSIRVWFALGASALLSGCTNYFAGCFSAVLCGLLFLYCFSRDRGKIKPILITGAVVVLLFLPCVGLVIGGIEHSSAQISFRERNLSALKLLPLCYETFSPCFRLGEGSVVSDVFIIPLLLALFLFWRFVSRRDTTDAKWIYSLFLIVVPALVFAIFSVYAMLRINLIYKRYFFSCYGIVWIFLAVQFSRIQRRNIVLVVLAGMFAVSTTITAPLSVAYEKRRSDDFELFVRTVSEKVGKNDVFFLSNADALSVVVDKFDARNRAFIFVPLSNPLMSPDEILPQWIQLRRQNSGQAAWVLLWTNDLCRKVFKKHIADEPLASRKSGIVTMRGSCELYRIEPASRLNPFFDEVIGELRAKADAGKNVER